MALPSAPGKTNSDSSSDDPKQSILTDLAGVIDAVNAILAHLGGSAITAGHTGQSYALQIGQGLQEDGNNPAGLTLKLVSGGAVKVGANGVEVDINGLTEDTAPDLANDFVATYDASATALKKVKGFRIGGSSVGARATIFTANGTYTPTQDGRVSVLLVGGGGGGGPDNNAFGHGLGQRGGRSVVAWKHDIAVTGSTGYSVVIGAAGTAGVNSAYPGGNGGDGGDTQFKNGATVLASAKGGTGGKLDGVAGVDGSLTGGVADYAEPYGNIISTGDGKAYGAKGIGGVVPGQAPTAGKAGYLVVFWVG